MRWLQRAALATVLVGSGYALGAWQIGRPGELAAQDNQVSELSDETKKKIVGVQEALAAAAQALKDENRLVPATKSVNAYAILCGGLNVVDDLESGRGVDPETFAALYAGDANDELKEFLAFDPEGRLTYKSKVVRIYPISRLQKLQALRLVLTGVVAPTAKTDNQ
ncbi:hypothetical protein [Planctellipticum variicoloris]|uniref:hypothetical protein n=1 Tax=Planctellipticum variicoloris TaxID=3064265 RepID=UPI002BF2F76F|nr:hypothetical protein SH412_002939 [Planctomycetaceae bacterium SH412]HTN00968.1 hypothetical protein [Planctomycetaceae bacterium]